MSDRLESVARTMEMASDYSEAEVFLWRQLAQHVDPDAFRRSGQIVLDEATLERVVRRGTTQGWGEAALEEAVAALMEKGRLSTVEKSGRGTKVRLILHSPWV